MNEKCVKNNSFCDSFSGIASRKTPQQQLDDLIMQDVYTFIENNKVYDDDPIINTICKNNAPWTFDLNKLLMGTVNNDVTVLLKSGRYYSGIFDFTKGTANVLTFMSKYCNPNSRKLEWIPVNILLNEIAAIEIHKVR